MKKVFKKYYRKWLRKNQKIHLLKISKPVYIDPSANFNFHNQIKIGKYARIGPRCHIDGEGGVTIGEGTIFAPNVTILTSSHDYQESELLPYGFSDKKKPVNIGKGCWLGWGVMIAPGVTIGDGVIIAMGSVVIKDVPSGQMIGGNPAIQIKQIHDLSVLNQKITQKKFYLKEVIEKNKIRAHREMNYLSENIIK